MVSVNPQSSNALVSTIQQPVKVQAVGSFDWVTSITSDADSAGRLSVLYSASKAVQYTVVAQRKPAFTYYVSGVITVANQNNQAVSATSVYAQLPTGYVLAVCTQDGRFPVVVAASGSIQCAFNATLTGASAAQGSVTATAVSTFGSSSSAVAVPYTLTPPQTDKESCAIVSDAVGTKPALAPSSLMLTGNKPYSADATPVCTDQVYNFTARLGPFDASACNMYTVRPVLLTYQHLPAAAACLWAACKCTQSQHACNSTSCAQCSDVQLMKGGGPPCKLHSSKEFHGSS